MGLLDSVKERIRGKDKTDVGRGGISYDRSAAKGQPSLDSALKRGAEQRTQKRSFKPYVEKVGRGIDRFNSGVDKFNRGAEKVSSLGASFGGSGGGRSKGSKKSGGSKRSSGGSMFGSGGYDMDDLGFSSFGSVGGGGRSRSTKKKAKGGGRGLVPIYSGSRIVGYTKANSGKKRKAKARSIFDIDI